MTRWQILESIFVRMPKIHTCRLVALKLMHAGHTDRKARNWEVGFLRKPFHQWTKVSWLNKDQGGLLLNNAPLSSLSVLIESNKWIHWKLTEMAAVYRLIKIPFELLFYYEEQRISNSMGELWALRAAIKASVNSNMAFCGTCFVWDLTQGP